MRPAIFLFVAALFASAAPGLAQASPCRPQLAEAEKSYKLGDFESIPAQLEACLPGNVPRSEKIRAYVLLARVYIALDDLGRARETVSALLRLDPDFEPGAPPQLARLVAEVRRQEAAVQVASVSKTNESLREAPATVIVVTAEQIERRGYLDLEQVLHDLPGFDITRGNGDVYSNIYQRGFRSNLNDRILLLVDGVEQSDLSSGAVHLSRQYPLSNVERLEVVYGPASTMYGANAYTGVINIVTKEPEALLPAGSRYGFSARAEGGNFGTRAAEASLAGSNRPGTFSWSLTGRRYRSDELDLSRFADWDYDYSSVDYREALRLRGSVAQEFCAGEPLPEIFHCQDDQVELTDAGVELARRIDQELAAREAFAFSDPTDDWQIHGKLKLANLTLGLLLWRRAEGTASWYTERRPGGQSGDVLAPAQTDFFLRYTRSVAQNLLLDYSARYKQTEIRTPEIPRFAPLASGSVRLLFLESCLEDVEECTARNDVAAFNHLSTQVATELSFVYRQPGRLDVVSGLELRKSSVENNLGGFLRGDDFVFITAPVAVEHTDLALYSQASYRLRGDLKLVAGGRLDYDENNSVLYSGAGYGTLFSPRLALVYTRPKTVFKAIYSEAFKDPTDSEKFQSFRDPATGIRGLANPKLSPEKVRNFELSLGWQPRKGASLDVAAYQADYSDLVGTVETTEADFPARKRVNVGKIQVRGLQADGTLDWRRLSIFGNYTYTEPVNTNPKDELGAPLRDAGGKVVGELRVGDIAQHRLNLGLNAPCGERLAFDLRLNYVGARRTGPGTTVHTNPFREIGPYFLAHATLSYKNLVPGTSLQLIVNNLFDERYDDPGVQEAGTTFAARIPQPGRTVFLRLSYGLAVRP